MTKESRRDKESEAEFHRERKKVTRQRQGRQKPWPGAREFSAALGVLPTRNGVSALRRTVHLRGR